MRDANLDSLFITSLTNVRWLTGFTGSNGWVLMTPDACSLITDGRYGDQAEQQTRGVASVLVGATRAAMVDHAAKLRALTVGFEAAHLSVAEHASLSSSIGGSWVSTIGVVEQGRRHKDQAEIERMGYAAQIADEALVRTLPLLNGEPTEVQFRDELEASMRMLGAEGPSFETIVAAGANAALPHHRPDQTRIVEGMSVVIDFGALYDGYHSDMTRTYFLGQPTPMQDEVYQVVLHAQMAGVDAVCAGAAGKDVDNLCRQRITQAGWGQWFTHGTGHGVGLEIHESPWLTQNFDDILRQSDVVTVEPGVYRRDFGGVRIEDMVVVTATGCQPLTLTPKDSPCLPSPPMT
jgi:Xaa-Pro aminopeptidase